ncbi:MAG: glycosyltransferase [Polynucleobacter sp.]|uniref:glycosyltransferase n=1 Tax=Polynucleobacter sp. TaxID=2029855 RepID=UPI002717C55E|nr:glycosyltransferase [Polynucleobacter sp.]MDO8715027.1 glycosyltransferase [Polynucleobacter sp.]
MQITKEIKFKFVVATRENVENFWTHTATGRSLALYLSPSVEVSLFANNSRGLPEVYNEVIDQCTNDPAILIFAHDDLHILDFHWMHAIFNGLNHFGVVGLAGNKRRVPLQPSWAFIDENFTWDSLSNLSGLVAHGKSFPPEIINNFGPPFEEVKLLDGLLLAAFSEVLIKKDLKFDELFKFHFYDLDFCRQAENKGIKMGTIPLSLIHESRGSLGPEEWRQGYQNYLRKWGQ